MDTFNIVDGDLMLDSKGNIGLASDLDAVRLLVEENLRMIKGEWTFNLQMGVPYFFDVFNRGISLGTIKTIFDTAVAKTQGVSMILKSDVYHNAQERKFAYRAVVSTIYGTTEVGTNG